MLKKEEYFQSRLRLLEDELLPVRRSLSHPTALLARPPTLLLLALDCVLLRLVD